LKHLLSKRGLILLSILLLIGFLVRPGAERLRGRVSRSMAQALGRNVEIGSVHLRFLPRLGFDLSNVVIHDDSAFGTEPLLRAPEVTAWLSIGALLRGKIAIANLTLSEASLNLTRSPRGRWNLEDLIERTSRTALAPTGSGHQGGRAIFPYIDATRARINFKSGMEKTHFALADAEFALWQDSENTWGVRLEASPIRTDANLTDTGLIKVEGLWRRAVEAHETPLQFSFQWKKAQVGQVSALITGADKGWRGGLTIFGAVVGRPEHLKITVDTSLDGFRRQDVFAGGNLRLSAHCGAEYSAATHKLTNVECTAPAGPGVIQVRGSATPAASPSSPLASYNLWLVADKVPAGSVLNTMQHVNPHFASDLGASGEINATLQLERNEAQSFLLDGHGSVDDLELSSGAAETVALGTIPFRLVQRTSPAFQQFATWRPGKSEPAKAIAHSEKVLAQEPRIEVGPVNLSSSKTAPLQARGVLSGSGYEASVHGETGIKRLFQLSHALGIPSPTVAADGSTIVDLAISGRWNGERPGVRGQAQLRSIRAQLRGLNAPLEISTADLSIEPERVRVQNLTASTGDVTWRGSLEVARPCRVPAPCAFQFSVHTTELSARELNDLLNPAVAQKPWYSFLSLSSGQAPFLSQAHARGNLVIDKLKLGTASCSHFAAELRLNSGELTLANMHAELLGGRASGEWVADFSSKPPKYRGKGTLKAASLVAVAGLMHDSWMDGAGSIDYDFNASGWTLEDVLASAEANAEFTIAPGTFSHVVLPLAPAPLRAENFSGNLQLQDGKLTFREAKLKTSGGVYNVSGTASLNGEISLKMAGATGYNITGTFLKTRVTTIPVAQAAMKP
jgi:AsmA protein